MKPATLAPIYVALYPKLAEFCRDRGYALAVHGTMARDFDLIAIPWVANPVGPYDLVLEMCEAFTLQKFKQDPTNKGHGRLCWSLTFSFDDCFLDFSVMEPKQ
jgi:hypothetical protein